MSNPEITQVKGSGCDVCQVCLDCMGCDSASILVGVSGYGSVAILF